MTESKDKITIHATLEINAADLQAIVRNAKKLAGADEKGIYRVDTAEVLNRLVSAFLDSSDFNQYINKLDNY